MNSKIKRIVTGIALVTILGSISTTGVLAQGQNGQQNCGFFCKIGRFLGMGGNQKSEANSGSNLDENGSLLPTPSGSPPSWSPLPMGMNDKNALDRLVSEGKITKDQETAILAEVKSLMEQMQSDLKTWATEKGIDPKYVLMAFSGGQGGNQDGGMQNGRQPNGPRPSGSPMPLPTSSD